MHYACIISTPILWHLAIAVSKVENLLKLEVFNQPARSVNFRNLQFWCARGGRRQKMHLKETSHLRDFIIDS